MSDTGTHGDEPAQDVELRLRITGGRSGVPWRAILTGPAGEAARQFDRPEDVLAFLRRHWMPFGLR